MTNAEDYSVQTARRAADRDELGDWVAAFLASPGSDNGDLAELLAEKPRWWIGPVELRISELYRLAGPPDDHVLCPMEDDEWGEGVEDLSQKIDDGLEPPPLVVSYRDQQLVVEDGNHRIEALRRTGARRAWAVVNFEDPDARDRFLEGDAP